MPTATVTSKGQITIPQPVRQRLGLHAGDRIDFVFEPDGKLVLHPKKIPFEQLCGILKSPFRKPVSVREMDRGIEKFLREKHRRIARVRRA